MPGVFNKSPVTRPKVGSGGVDCRFFNERPVTIAKVNHAGVDCRLQSLSTDAEMKLSINSTF